MQRLSQASSSPVAIIGILQIEQKSKKKAERNDRLFAVPRRSHSEQGRRDVRELSKPIQQELEKFFIATDELEDKELEIYRVERPQDRDEGRSRIAPRIFRRTVGSLHQAENIRPHTPPLRGFLPLFRPHAATRIP